MGFRFRKSFKLMPGVRVNLSKSGISTTVGPRGASVNISKSGTYLNTGIPGTGISSRSQIGGSRSVPGRPIAQAQAQIPQPASTRTFSFGVTLSAIGLFSCVTVLLAPSQTSTSSNPWAGIAFWLAFGTIWWVIRKARRASKQRVYEAYIQKQVDEATALRLQLEEAEIQRTLNLQYEANARSQSRLDSFEPQLIKARALVREGLATEQQLVEWEKSLDSSWMTPNVLGSSIDHFEQTARTEQQRRDTILTKYDGLTAQKLLARQIELGMSREQVIDALGETSKTERTLLKGVERETLVYGSKNSGSYFHIVDGTVTKAVSR